MNNTTLTYLLIVGVIGMAAIMVLNFTGVSQSPFTENYLSPNDVRGIDVAHGGKLWTLNFEQQNKLVNILNKSTAIEGHFNPDKFEVDRVIIYLFNKPDLIVTPLQLVNKALVFSVPEWNSKGYLKESQPGQMLQLLSDTYDH